MRVVIIVILSIVLIGISAEIYLVLKERNQLNTELEGLSVRIDSLLKENENLQSDIEYFSEPENLEKELRLKFNYKEPGEKMIIVVP